MKQDKEKPEEKKVYTYQDLLKFASTQAYSSIGSNPLSVFTSLPQYSFGTGTRDSLPKLFTSAEMAMVDCFGKNTPQGPNYNVSSKFSYNSSPTWKIGTQERPSLGSKAKYEHYFRKDIDFDLNEADRSRRLSPPITRIGLESRFTNDPKRFKATPGPQYNPPERKQYRKNPEYSLYSRRAVKGFDPLILLTSTPSMVGPSSYYPQKAARTSNNTSSTGVVIGTGPKLEEQRPCWDLNQTYDLTSSVGTQFTSKRLNAAGYSIGRSKRDGPSGIFKSHMENRPMQVRLEHPRF